MSLVLTLALVVGLVALDARTARAAVQLTVTTWNANTDTGYVTYDASLQDVCDTSSCYWKIEAYFISGGVEKAQATLGSGTVYASASNPVSFTGPVSGAKTLRETTHLRATVTPSSGSPRISTVQVSDPYPTGSIDLSVDQWQVNTDTGAVTYDVTMKLVGAGQENGPCTSRCFYYIQAWYKDGTAEKLQHTLHSYDCLSGCWTVMKQVSSSTSGAIQITKEVTDLRAFVKESCTDPCTKEVYEDWVSVSPPYPDGSIDVTVSKWEADVDTGAVTYDVTMKFTGAKQENGPCTSRCYYYVQAWYKDGSTEKLQHTLHSYDCLSGCWGVTTQLASSMSGAVQVTREVTHLRAYVTPASCTDPCAQETYEKWVAVHPPYPSGSISLDVSKWQRQDPTYVDYDITMIIRGAGQVNGPCEGTRCYYRVEAWSVSGSTQSLKKTLYSYDCLSGCWTVSKRLAATAASLPEVTHLRAHVFPSSCSSPCTRESYDTGLIPLSDYIYKNQDMIAAAAVLNPVLTRNPTFFCERFLVRAGTHHARSSLSDQYLACEAAVGTAEYTIYKVLESILDAPGPATIDDFDPDPFPSPDPSVPPVRQDWKLESGCEQNIPESSVDAVAGHIEERHGYGSTAEASKWAENAPWRDLVWPYAMRYKATLQELRPWRCQRIIEYIAPVGYEYIFATSEYRLTSTYTVITDTLSGALVTAFPGVPGDAQS